MSNVKYEYFVSYNAVNKEIGSAFGDITFTMDAKIDSPGALKQVREHIANELHKQVERKFNVVIVNYQLLREVDEA